MKTKTPPDDPYEGCGITPFTTGPNDVFASACSWHDKTYLNQSWHEKNLERRIVDLQFYHQMLLISGDNLILRAKAWAYYRIARLFGARFWEGEK